MSFDFCDNFNCKFIIFVLHCCRTTKGHHEVHLSLKRSLEGPQEIEIDLTMTVFTRGLPRGKSVAKVFIIVSQYTF